MKTVSELSVRLQVQGAARGVLGEVMDHCNTAISEIKAKVEAAEVVKE